MTTPSKANLELAMGMFHGHDPEMPCAGPDGYEIAAALDEAERRGAEAMRERAVKICADEAVRVRGLTGLEWDELDVADRLDECREDIAALDEEGGGK